MSKKRTKKRLLTNEDEQVTKVIPSLAVLDVERKEELLSDTVWTVLARGGSFRVGKVTTGRANEVARIFQASLAGWWREPSKLFGNATNFETPVNG